MIAKLPVLAGSAAVIVLMVSAAFALGFRGRTRVDDAALAELAKAQGAVVEAAAIAPNARSAIARLSGDKLMIVRVMGADLSVRLAPISALRVSRSGETFRVGFADIGFPPLHLRLKPPPLWLAELTKGESR